MRVDERLSSPSLAKLPMTMTMPDPIQWTQSQAPALGSFSRAQLLAGAGSERCYWRLEREEGSSVILMRYGPDREENRAFAPLTYWLLSHRLGVPQIFAVLEEDLSGWIWLEDLGCRDLLDMTRLGGEEAMKAYEATAHELARWHALDLETLPENAKAQLQTGFDLDLYHWEHNYFWDQGVARFSSLDASEIERLRQDPALEDLAQELVSWPLVAVHRDFQSTNVMVREDDSIGIIDYQGLRLGVREYDLASLVYDPYVVENPQRTDRFLRTYAELAEVEYEGLDERVRRAGIQRLMQALGAFGKLGLGDGKAQFLEHVDPAKQRLAELAAGTELEAVLSPALERLVVR